jgi:WD40 repeat protein
MDFKSNNNSVILGMKQSSINNDYKNQLEFEDAYIIEEKNIIIPDNEDDDDDDIKDLELNSLDLSDDEKDESLNYEKLKITAENNKLNRVDGIIGISSKVVGAHTEFTSKIVRREEVVEDFIRNFFTRHKLHKTLENFNVEYNDLVKKGKFYDNILGPITDVRIKNAKLEDKKKKLERELEKAKKNADSAKSQWESLRKERDFHKENYSKTVNEKEQISRDIKALEQLHDDFSLKITDLSRKYEHLCKSKSLLRLDVEKMKREVDEMENNISEMQIELEKMDNKQKLDLLESKIEGKNSRVQDKKLKPGELTPWPQTDTRMNLYLLRDYNPITVSNTSAKPIKVSDKPVACIAVHIKKHVVGVGSDDASYYLYDMTNNQILAQGTGHTDYVSGIDIHPKGTLLVTGSGDHTIKLWDLFNMSSKSTYYDHNSIVWSVKFHDEGNFFVSGSEDSTIKVWDINADKSRHSIIGHTASVNKIEFQPFSNFFASCSVDKTISIWDTRTNHTVQTYYGHLNSVNDIAFSPRGDELYSCDSDGIVKSWDLRKVQETHSYYFGDKMSANCLTVDKSNTRLYVGFETGNVKLLNLTNYKEEGRIDAHKTSCNQMGINLSNSHVYTVGGDGVLNVFQ